MAAGVDPSPPVSLLEISRVLEETARLLRRHAGAPEPPPGLNVTAADVRAVIAARWLRRRYLGFEPGEAAWSMVLELYAARLEGLSMSQTRLGIAAGVPQTTALRETRRMLEAGVFRRRADPADKRLLLIDLTDETARRTHAYLAATGGLAGLAA